MINVPSDIRKMYTDEGYVVVTHDSGSSVKNQVIGDAEKELLEHLKYMVDKYPQAGAAPVVTHKAEKVPDKKSEISAFLASSGATFDIPTIIEYVNWHMNGSPRTSSAGTRLSGRQCTPSSRASICCC